MNVSIVLPWVTTIQPSWIQSFSSIGTVIISLLALVFGLFNFWYGNWRKGKIIVGDPVSYAMVFGPGKSESKDRLMVFVPLIFLNDGGMAQFIQDMRLFLQQNSNESDELLFGRSYLSWDDNKGMMAQPFAIEGHKAYSAVFMFLREPSGFAPTEGVCNAKLEVKLNEENWKIIHSFTFNIQHNQEFNRLIPRRCDVKIESDR